MKQFVNKGESLFLTKASYLNLLDDDQALDEATRKTASWISRMKNTVLRSSFFGFGLKPKESLSRLILVVGDLWM